MSSKPAMLKLAAANAVLAPHVPMTRESGDQLLRSGGLHALRDALGALLERPLGDVLGALRPDDGWTLFWLGFVQQFDLPLDATAAWRAAERRFAACGDARGLDLVACGLMYAMQMDNQNHHGLVDVLARVRQLQLTADTLDPLALYGAGARLLGVGQDPDRPDPDPRDVERVFAALGGPLDAELRLHCAAAAMHGVGLSMDRVLAADYHQAGAAVAALPQVSAITRCRWQVFVSSARWHDASAVPRLADELAAVERDVASGPGRRLVAWSRALRALHGLSDGLITLAGEHLEIAHRHLDPAYPLDYALYHFVFARVALRQRDPQAALAHVTMCLRLSEEGGAVAGDLTPVLNLSGAVHAALGRYDDAVRQFARAAELSIGAPQIAVSLCHLHLAHGAQLFGTGAQAEARTELAAGFAQARSADYTMHFRVLPEFAAEVYGVALDLDVETAYVRKVIAMRPLACPDRGIAGWPWPLRVRALGGFALERDGEPFKFGRKAPKRLLDVLRAVVALGGVQVDGGRVASLLWPDADGDEGRSALKTMLHRARSLLGSAWLLVRDGQISFDAKAVWLDTWAFEHVSGRIESLLLAGPASERTDDGELERRRLQLFALYRGNLFGESDVPAWALQTRDRLRARFVRAIDLLGQRLERRGRHDDAIALYRAALEQDNLAEELYQRLMECHLARGEDAQALNAYRRCRELLSIVLGLKPSARTDALAACIGSR
jgi:DNA-binding SARP family transcriptional activator